jgi:hypothetical protein
MPTKTEHAGLKMEYFFYESWTSAQGVPQTTNVGLRRLLENNGKDLEMREWLNKYNTARELSSVLERMWEF